MTGPLVHVVGAGLAGLSTAIRLVERGVAVTIHEAAAHAGGRCRSYHDPKLDRMIDNGNHLLLSGNRDAMAFLDTVGARDALTGPGEAAFPFVDLTSGERWKVRMNPGPIPLWLLRRLDRVPGATFWDYLQSVKLAFAGAEVSVAEAIRDRGPLWTRFWEPMTLAALNAPPERASAQLLWAVLRETFAKGGRHCRPLIARNGLGPALVDPALAWLRARGGEIVFNQPIQSITREAGRVAALTHAGGEIVIGLGDGVVVATPPSRLRALLPELDPPPDLSGILNAHFLLPPKAVLEGPPSLLGVLSAKTHWIFRRGEVASVTISAADAFGVLDQPADDLLTLLWGETRQALGLPSDTRFSAGRIVKERRATFDQSPEGVAKRPQPETPLNNLILAGDATDTRLPASIEGAIRSGKRAARLISDRLRST